VKDTNAAVFLTHVTGPDACEFVPQGQEDDLEIGL
jgi:hypothetical protein